MQVFLHRELMPAPCSLLPTESPFSSTGKAFPVLQRRGSKGLQTEVALGGLCFLFSSFRWRDSFGSWWGTTVPRLQRWWEVVN